MQIQIIVEDNGIVIDKENIERKFIDFDHINEDDNINDTGKNLNLSICKNIINKMGGSV